MSKLTRPDDPRGAHMADRLATHALSLAICLAIAAVIAITWVFSRR